MIAYVPVRTPRGRRVHAVRATGDLGDGEAQCGRRAPSGWVVVPDAALDCLRCLQRITARK